MKQNRKMRRKRASELVTDVAAIKRIVQERDGAREAVRRLRLALNKMHRRAQAIESEEGKQAKKVLRVEAERDGLRGALTMSAARLGGEVDGAPTHRGNLLQRIDVLRGIENACEQHLHHVGLCRKRENNPGEALCTGECSNCAMGRAMGYSRKHCGEDEGPRRYGKRSRPGN